MSADCAETPRRRAFTVGLTGGIASGKTTVANLFAARGAVVIDTDQIARDVVEPGQPALDRIATAFGPGVLDVSGRLDRRGLRQIVFADPAKRRLLEEILHPAIRAELAARALAADGPYQIHVVPLLVESSRREGFDRILVVDCPPDRQLARLLQRDAETVEQAESIIAAQVDRERRLQAADDVIRNDGTPEDLSRRVDEIHQLYLSLASRNR
ncbi:MAG: dephospho-CoA kinase [Steroidobacteraceae bacterium]